MISLCLGCKFVLTFPRFRMYISAICFCQLMTLEEQGSIDKCMKHFELLESIFLHGKVVK